MNSRDVNDESGGDSPSIGDPLLASSSGSRGGSDAVEDPNMARDWVDDPWDNPDKVPETSFADPDGQFAVNGRAIGNLGAFGLSSARWRAIVRATVFAVVAAMLTVGLAGWWVVQELNPGTAQGAPVNFTVNKDDTEDAVIARLAAGGFIGNETVFRWYVRTRGGLDLVPGYYQLRPGDSAGNIVEALSTSPAETFVNVTFPEGMTLTQMGQRLAEKIPFLASDKFVSAATDGSVSSALAPQGVASLEGLLFPDTYQVSGDDTESRVVARLASTMERVASQVDLTAGAKLLGFTPYEVLIVASMIEREAKTAEDRPKIARVIYNRLKAKMLLQIDATLKYNQDPATPWEQLKAADTPYNTYLKKGLPPTPIANPGRASLEAALAPAPPPKPDDEACQGLGPAVKCDYFYYVLDDADGGHKFATTLEQHEANVAASLAAGVLP